MKVTVTEKPSDYIAIIVKGKTIELHNDDWVDVRDALQEFFEARTARQAND